MNILIVDDDKIDRESVKRSLLRKQENISFYEADSGAEAIKLLGEMIFDCVFLDFHLPDIDGVDVLRQFYDLEKGLAAAPIVMLTGQGSESVMIEAIRWGSQDYLVKDNISPDTLNIALTKAREMYQLQQAKFAAEERLRQSSKMEAVGQLTSGMAHDFNNLLTVILGNTRLMHKRLREGDEKFSREDLRKKVAAVEVSAKKGADLVNRLMVFTRQRELKQEIINPNEKIFEIHELLKRTLGEIIETKLVLPEGIWSVELDSSQFENALINLALNARDAMPKGGRLTIETKNIILDEKHQLIASEIPAGHYIMVAISDTGEGMPKELKERVFEPFFTTKETGKGTGLGLSMVYGFVGQSRGFIRIYSEVGHGTIFRIYLPKQETEENASVEETELSLPTGNETILLIEDDEAVRDVTANSLEDLGYHIIQAPGGENALDILESRHAEIDLLFTDIIMLGGMSGTELVSKVRSNYPKIKILFTSGYSEHAIPDISYIIGSQLIEKPYYKQDLAHKIRQVLDD